jgi:hypothetical protein
MNYWISVACLNHINRGIEKGLFGVGHGKIEPLQRMQPGDKIVFYAPKIDFMKNDKENIYQKFKGYGTIDDKPIFTEDIGSRCMARRNITFEGTKKEVSVHELLDLLSFIKDKKHWGFPFMRGYIKITEEDWGVITAGLKE